MNLPHQMRERFSAMQIGEQIAFPRRYQQRVHRAAATHMKRVECHLIVRTIGDEIRVTRDA